MGRLLLVLLHLVHLVCLVLLLGVLLHPVVLLCQLFRCLRLLGSLVGFILILQLYLSVCHWQNQKMLVRKKDSPQ